MHILSRIVYRMTCWMVQFFGQRLNRIHKHGEKKENLAYNTSLNYLGKNQQDTYKCSNDYNDDVDNNYTDDDNSIDKYDLDTRPLCLHCGHNYCLPMVTKHNGVYLARCHDTLDCPLGLHRHPHQNRLLGRF